MRQQSFAEFPIATAYHPHLSIRMSWLTVAWSMVAGASLTFGAVHFFIWLQRKEDTAQLFLFLAAFGAAGCGFGELALIHTTEIAHYSDITRLGHIPIAITVGALAWFVPTFLKSGPRWTAWLVTFLWGVALILNFTVEPNLAFSEIETLQRVPTFNGEFFTLAKGTRNPLSAIADAASLVFIIGVLISSVSAYRRGRQTRAAIVGGSVLVFMLAAGIHTPLVDIGVVRTPYAISFAFLAIVTAMSYQTGREMHRLRIAEKEVGKTRREIELLMRRSLLGEMASALAHELNQPLTAILSNAQAAIRFLGQDPPDLGEFREILTDIVRDDKRAGKIIEGMRAMVKPAPSPDSQTTVDLEPAVRDALELMEAELHQRQARVEYEADESFPPVQFDAVEIQQVIVNLTLNALEAMRNTPVENRVIRIEGRRQDGHVEIAVHDRGTGIPEEKIETIFEPFFTSRASGMGIGLAITRRLIESHHGTIRAENNPGGGATFRFTLPVADPMNPSGDE